MGRICKKCLLQDLEEKERAKLQKYLAVIADADRCEEERRQERLAICRECDRLAEATCEACGCYVEFRAALKRGKCPYKKW